MLGQDVVYDRLPYFYTDQYDLGMEYTGHAPPGDYDTVVVRGDLAKRRVHRVLAAGGRVLAGMNVNVWDVTDTIATLIRTGRTINTESLADPGIPLEALVEP